jgi:hypothetical protein
MLVKMHELVPSGDRMDTPSPGPRRLKKAASRSTHYERAPPIVYGWFVTSNLHEEGHPEER